MFDCVPEREHPLKVYAGMDPRLSLPDVIAHARRIEALGYDGLHVSETVHDALALSLLVAEHTERITIRTSVALAFVRSPTLTAYAAWDLAKLSNGRFQLGLGTQIRQNIEDRYAMGWTDPVERMRDYLGALRALFECFRTGEAIRYEGTSYRITRMQPYFNPGPDKSIAVPPLWLGGVNAGICRLAGEMAEGFITHPTNSNPRYLETLCLPNLLAGAETAGRDLRAVELVVGTQVITGATLGDLDAERERQRRLFAFLYSTPAYRRTLELYGWEDLATRLGDLVRHDRWENLTDEVTDEVLDTLIPSACFGDLPELLNRRFGHLCQGITLAPPTDPVHDGEFAEVIAALRQPVPADTPSSRRIGGG
jgi:probable F420-dependent oxidoreductase